MGGKPERFIAARVLHGAFVPAFEQRDRSAAARCDTCFHFRRLKKDIRAGVEVE